MFRDEFFAAQSSQLKRRGGEEFRPQYRDTIAGGGPTLLVFVLHGGGALADSRDSNALRFVARQRATSGPFCFRRFVVYRLTPRLTGDGT
jgi:hypothetical protein